MGDMVFGSKDFGHMNFPVLLGWKFDFLSWSYMSLVVIPIFSLST